ncbi:DUF4214 domain-containing protein [Massilia sp. DD77]|uniref:DUF4214 domain-containing protein n=1 Tax=Massilia sp. DD77 TaxID=3109349 RepID=UPI002FFFA49F
MTIVRIKLSQAVVDTNHALNDNVAGGGVDVGDPIGGDGEVASLSAWNLNGETLRMDYTDGSSETYYGVKMDNPGGARGFGSATSMTYLKPGLMSMNMSGKFEYDYAFDGSTLTLTQLGGLTINGIRIATLYPSTSPDYDKDLGNVTLSISGDIKVYESGETRGAVTTVATTAEKFMQSSVVEGNFRMGNNIYAGSDGLEGTLTGYRVAYYDGSYQTISNTSSFLQTGEMVDELLYRGSTSADEFSIELPGTLYSEVVIAAAEGDDVIALKGGGGRLSVAAGDGNDVVTLLGDRQNVDGGRGIDTVKLAVTRAEAGIKAVVAPANPDPRYPPVESYTLTDKQGAQSKLINVERIVLSDATLALDIEGNAGQTYRLYQAAFNRTPDAGGLGYWINAMDKGANLTDVAASFLAAPEGVTSYGGSLSNAEIVTRFYQNILHREPDAGGRDYWTGLIDQNKATVAQVLAGISESAENKIGLVGVIGNGFAYTPWEQG